MRHVDSTTSHARRNSHGSRDRRPRSERRRCFGVAALGDLRLLVEGAGQRDGRQAERCWFVTRGQPTEIGGRGVLRGAGGGCAAHGRVRRGAHRYGVHRNCRSWRGIVGHPGEALSGAAGVGWLPEERHHARRGGRLARRRLDHGAGCTSSDQGQGLDDALGQLDRWSPRDPGSWPAAQDHALWPSPDDLDVDPEAPEDLFGRIDHLEDGRLTVGGVVLQLGCPADPLTQAPIVRPAPRRAPEPLVRMARASQRQDLIGGGDRQGRRRLQSGHATPSSVSRLRFARYIS